VIFRPGYFPGLASGGVPCAKRPQTGKRTKTAKSDVQIRRFFETSGIFIDVIAASRKAALQQKVNGFSCIFVKLF
jgi:hypothetical protein